MVDNLLLEKRNRYLGKLIKKTHDLTDSVKLLSSIDRELYSQSGGTLTSELDRIINKGTVVQMTSGNNLEGLTREVNTLVETIRRFSNFEEHLRGIPAMVRYVNAPATQAEMEGLIQLIHAEIGKLNDHDIYKIVEFLQDSTIKPLIRQYVTTAAQYNSTTDQNAKREIYQTLVDMHNQLKRTVTQFVSVKKYSQDIQQLLLTVINSLYSDPSAVPIPRASTTVAVSASRPSTSAAAVAVVAPQPQPAAVAGPQGAGPAPAVAAAKPQGASAELLIKNLLINNKKHFSDDVSTRLQNTLADMTQDQGIAHVKKLINENDTKTPLNRMKQQDRNTLVKLVTFLENINKK